MEREKINEILAKHKKWLNNEEGGERADLSYADLSYADLSYADLRDAELRGAELRDADLDFSVLPLWCGSLDMKIDARIAAQIAYHFCRLDCEDTECIKARNAIVDFANTFHCVKECGKVEQK